MGKSGKTYVASEKIFAIVTFDRNRPLMMYDALASVSAKTALAPMCRKPAAKLSAR